MVALSLLTVAALGASGAAAVKANFPPIPKDLTTPVQQRLAFHDPNAVSVGWNTYEKLDSACVKYGTSKSSLNKKTCSNSSITYDTSRTWSNYVTLTGLKSSTNYYYKIVSGNSTTAEFKSGLTVGDTTPFNTAVVVDLGVYGANGWTIKKDHKKRELTPDIEPELNHTTIGALARAFDNFDFVVHPGDFAYADDWYYTGATFPQESNIYESIIERFYEQLADISAYKPYMAAPGNHEAVCIENGEVDTLCPVGQRNFSDFMNRFGRITPKPFASKSKNSTAVSEAKKAASLALNPMWYSFEYGMAHFVMINTETDFFNAPDTHGSYDLDVGPFGSKKQQLDFLKADLASVDRSVTPWIIVSGHRPWYSTGGYGNQCFACQNAFEETLYKYGVDLALFGHVHNSQRFDPIFNNKTDPAGLNNPKAPMYIVAGGAGNIEGLSSVGTNLTGNRFAYADTQSFAMLEFKSKTHLTVKFYNSENSDLLDEATLYKKHNVDFVVQ